MNASIEALTKTPPDILEKLASRYTLDIRVLQSKLAHVRKAQKNQKRAAKDRNKVVG